MCVSNIAYIDTHIHIYSHKHIIYHTAECLVYIYRIYIYIYIIINN